MEQHDELMLWEYIDGSCSEADRVHIAALIASDNMWAEQFNSLSALHAGMSGYKELEQPSLRFSKNVLEAVGGVSIAPATKKYLNNKVIGGIAALFLIGIAAALGYALFSADWTSHSSDDLSSKLMPIAQFNLGQLIKGGSLNIITGVNIVLGLVMADKLIRRRKGQGSF